MSGLLRKAAVLILALLLVLTMIPAQVFAKVSGTIVSEPEDDGQYAVIIEVDDDYYVVENDGTLTSLDDIEFNDDGSVKSIKLNNPIFWNYTTSGSDHTIWHNTAAREYDTGTSLPKSYNRRYIDVSQTKGLSDKADNDPVIPVTYYENKLYYGDSYLGVDDSGAIMTLKGGCPQSDAAQVYLVKLEDNGELSEASAWYHTVSHIDIAVKGTAGMKMALAWGTYKLAILSDEDLADINDMSDDEIIAAITGYGDDLVVSGDNNVDAEAERLVPIVQDDIRKADISAYVKSDDGTQTYLDNVYKVTGYSGNTEYDESADPVEQVRMEGVFKVSDLKPISKDYALTEAEANRKNYIEDGVDTGKPIKDVRLERPIFYEVDISKDVTFTMTYKSGGTTYVVITDEGQPIRKTAKVTLTSTFSYWDSNNECPAIHDIHKEPVESSNETLWTQGEILSNDADSAAYTPKVDWHSGMDFRVGAPSKDAPHDSVAIEVTKYIEGDDGFEIRQLTLQQEESCSVNIYQGDEFLREKEIKVGTDGMGQIYDYGVKGGTYDEPAYAQIAEIVDSVKDVIIDADGVVWIYDHTVIETEYVWRNDGRSERWKNEYDKNGSASEFLSHEELLGEYKHDNYPYTNDDGTENTTGEEFNRFLEFYIHNIYTNIGSLKIKKNVTVNDLSMDEIDDENLKPYVDGTYVFTVVGTKEKDDGTKVSKTVGITFENGEISEATITDTSVPDGETIDAVITDDGSVVVDGLYADTYTVTEEEPENGTALAEGIENPQQITVYSGNIGPDGEETINTADFTNNINVGSLKIKKNVTVNGEEPDEHQAAFTDGTYTFYVEGTIEDEDGSTLKKTITITFENGEIVSAEIDGEEAEPDEDGCIVVKYLPPDTYTVTEETPTNGTYLVGDESVTIVVNGGQEEIKTAEFTNDFKVGSIDVIKKVEGEADGAPEEFVITVKFGDKYVKADLTEENGTTYAYSGLSDDAVKYTIKTGKTYSFIDLPAGEEEVYSVAEDETAAADDAEKNGYFLSVTYKLDGEKSEADAAIIIADAGDTASVEIVNRYAKIEEPHKKEISPYEGTGELGAVNVGDEITYEISYTNFKNVEAKVVIKDTLDPNVEFVKASDGGTLKDGVVIWTLENVPAETEGKVTLTVKVLEGALKSKGGPGEVVNGGESATVEIDNDYTFTLEFVSNPVYDPEVPVTSDSNEPRLWASLLTLALCVLILNSDHKKRARR